jgi:uncharacterized protein (DUF1015 family)
MSLIRPFRALRPAAGRAADVIAPPYDVLNRDEAVQRSDGRPWSFLHISRAEIDLPPDTDPYDPAVYQQSATALNKMVNAGVLVRDAQPSYYAYRLEMDGRAQLGFAAIANVLDYDSNRIRKHEFTRPAKEDDRVRQIDALNAQTGPVLLACRHDDELLALLKTATTGEPDINEIADDDVRHTLWTISDSATVKRITAIVDAMPALYIADGHHRSAAGSRIAATRRVQHPDAGADASFEYFLTVIFADSEMHILDYNRVVKDLNGLSKDDFLARVAENFSVSAEDAAAKPAAANEFGMYLDGQWYRLGFDPARVPANDPVARLDVSLLAANLIDPVLGISDPRRDARIDFVGGIRGLGELEKRVDNGDWAVAFALYATSMDDLMSVAEAGEVMPPKSTWFEPKLADGLVSHVLD